MVSRRFLAVDLSAVHVHLHGDRRPHACGRAAVQRVLLQGRDHRAAVRARRLAHRARRARLRRLAADRDLHVPDDLPRVLRRPGAGGAGARARPSLPRRAPDEPDDRRDRGHRRRVPGAGAPHRRARVPDEDRDGRAGRPGGDRRRPADPGRDRLAAHFLEPTFADSSLLRGARAVRHADRDRPAGRRRARGRRHLHRMAAVRAPAASAPAALQERFAGLHTSSSTSGTSTRRSTS